jgi:hypothetical protein
MQKVNAAHIMLSKSYPTQNNLFTFVRWNLIIEHTPLPVLQDKKKYKSNYMRDMGG